MLYSDKDIVVKKIPEGNTTLKIGEPAPENYVLSPTDIATAKAIY